MAQTIVTVDAFTDRPFAGNPAGVCVLQDERDEAWMQDVAREMNLAETAFLLRREDGFGLRWFTPAAEVDLCGHATLASAHVLWETSALAPTATARFHTRSGLLTAERRGEWIELDFPVTPPEPVEAPPGLAEALGAQPVYVGRSRFDYLVEVRDEATVRALRPELARVAQYDVRGVIVTAASASAERDFVSRFFAPRVGVPEDPVTGSAHCCLAAYWSRRLGKTRFLAHQVSARGGAVRVELRGDRVGLGGRAVTVLRGEIVA
jgi:PhzF family phenazine biosynthesis protein